jgi:hypothetical protein
MRTLAVIGFISLFCLSDARAQTTFSAPILGFVYNPAGKNIRPVTGVPGAASLEDAQPMASKFRSGAVSPNGRYTVATFHGEDGVFIVELSNAKPAPVQLNGATAADLIAFSSDGNAAALYSRETGKVQLWRSLPQEISLNAELGIGQVNAIAVSQDLSVVAGVSEDSLVLAGEDGPRSVLAGHFTAITFVGDGRELAIADGTGKQILLVRDVTGQPETTMLAGAPEGIAEPVAIATSPDGAKVIVGDRGSRGVVAIYTAGRTSAVFRCDCSPEHVSRAQGTAVFLITTPENELHVFDGDSPEPRLLTIIGGVQ